jgi:DHA2 family multidrug resistance protein
VLATLAFVGFAGVFFMRSHYTTSVDPRTLVLPTLLQGIPTAVFLTPLTAILLSGLPPEKIPAAAGLSNFVRTFFGAAGTSIVGNLWNDRTVLHHAQLAEQSSIDNPAFSAAVTHIQQTLDGGTPQAFAMFESTLNAQATMLGLNDIFWLSGVLFLVIVPIIWITRPDKNAAAAAAGAGGH